MNAAGPSSSRRFQSGLVGLLVGVGVVVYVGWRQAEFFRGLTLNIRESTLRELRPGMTVDEISAVVGAQPGSYRSAIRFRAVAGNADAIPHIVFWENELGDVEAKFGTLTRPTTMAEEVWWRPIKPDLRRLYVDAAVGFGYAAIFLVAWFAHLEPLIRRTSRGS